MTRLVSLSGVAAVVLIVAGSAAGGLLDHIGVIPVTGLGIWMLVVSVLLYKRAAIAA